MQLSPEQLKAFDELGFLVMPDCFSKEEVAVLRSEAEAIYRSDRQEVWRETSGAPRTAFAAHTYNEAFAILGRHPRLIRPLEQFFSEPVYMHQFTTSPGSPAPSGSPTATSARSRRARTTRCSSWHARCGRRRRRAGWRVSA